MKKDSLPYKKGSLSHSVMMYASMKRREYITVDGVLNTLGSKAEKPSRVLRSIEMLCRNGLLYEFGEGRWRITVEGIDLLWRTATPYNGEAGFMRKNK